MTRKNYLVALTACLILVGCNNANEHPKVDSVKVKTLKIVPTPIEESPVFSGTIEEMSGSSLSFSSMGTLQNIYVSTGQHIRKGELLAKIDDATLQNTYQAAVATLDQAKDAYMRMEQLHKKGSLPEIQWVETQTLLKQAESAEKIAKKSLDDSRLYAPFSGVIAEKNVEMGQSVMPGMSVVKLVTIDKVKVRIAVPENEVATVQLNQLVQIQVPALSDKAFTGHIVEKGITANSMSRSYEVKALVDNVSSELMPGMICRMEFQQNEKQTAFLVPNSAVQLDEKNNHFVWVNVAGKAQKRIIQTGTLTKEGVIVTTGLQPGDEILIEGQQKISESMELTTY